MKNYSQLNSILQTLEQQKTISDSIEDISIHNFFICKKNALKKKRVKNKMKKMLCSAQHAIESYNNYTNSLIKNNSINCRKYHKLEKKAKYLRDLKLYKLGFIKEKPTLPLFQKLNSNLKKFIIPLFNPFVKIYEQYIHFKSIVLPKRINDIAINAAKLSICGYRKIKSDCQFIKKHFDSCNSAQYMSNVMKLAKLQLEASDSSYSKKTNAYTSSDAVSQYKQSLRLSPSITYTSNRGSNKKVGNYELTL